MKHLQKPSKHPSEQVKALKTLVETKISRAIAKAFSPSTALLMTIGGIRVYWNQINGTGCKIWYTAGMTIDGDGHPKCYHPKGSPPGLDYLGNAGEPGNWWALATDNGKSSGNPIVQNRLDPAPGFYVSMTAYTHAGFDYEDPMRYLHSGEVPFCVIPPTLRNSVKPKFLGCHAQMENLQTGEVTNAVMGDIGPNGKLGEASMMAQERMGYKQNPKSGISKRIIRYTLFPGVPAIVDGVKYRLL